MSEEANTDLFSKHASRLSAWNELPIFFKPGLFSSLFDLNSIKTTNQKPKSSKFALFTNSILYGLGQEGERSARIFT